MEEKILNNRDKWLRSVFATLLGAAAIEIFDILYGTLAGNKDVSEFVPWTFHTLWEIAALAGIAYAVKKCNIPLETYFPGLVFGALLVGIIWIFVPDNLKVLEANYYGVQSRMSMETHEEGIYYERVEYDFPLSTGLLFRKDDPELKRKFYEARNYNEYIGTKGFLFWQTGLAYGFNPIGIDEYNGGHGFLNRIELFFTVGPMVILESFIRGLATNFLLLMLAQIFWFLIRKEQVWWD